MNITGWPAGNVRPSTIVEWPQSAYTAFPGVVSQPPLSGFNALAENWVNDSNPGVASTAGGINYNAHTPYANIRPTPNGTSLTVELLNVGTGLAWVWAETSATLPHTFVQQLDVSGTTANTKSTVTITGLTVGVRLWIEFGGGAAELTGIGGVGETYFLSNAVPPKHRVYVLGDSIPVGDFASTGATLAQGLIGLTRHATAHLGYGFLNDSIFGRALGSAQVAGNPTIQTTTINRIVAAFDGTTDNTLLTGLAGNDWHSSVQAALHTDGTPNLEDNAGSFVDQLHTAAPTAKIIWYTGFQTTIDSTLNTFSENYEAYRTAIRNMQATRTSVVTLLEGVTQIGSESTYNPTNDSVDGLHPNGSAGHPKLGGWLTGYFGQTVATSIAGTWGRMNAAVVGTVTNPLNNVTNVLGTTNMYTELGADTFITIFGTPLLTGTSPAVTWSGALTAAANYVPFIKVDTGGTLPSATVKVSWDGGATFAGGTLLAISSGTLALTPPTGGTLTITFPAGTYVLNDTYTATCSEWDDLNGNGIQFINTTAGQQPKIIFQALNGHLGLKFDGVDDFLQSTLSITAPGTTPAFIWLLCRTDTWTSTRRVCGGITGNSIVIFMSASTPSLRIFAGTQAESSNGAAVGSFKRVQAGFNNSTTYDFITCGSVNSGTGTSAGNTGGGNYALAKTSTLPGAVTIVAFAAAKVKPTAGNLTDLDTVATNIGGAAMIT